MNTYDDFRVTGHIEPFERDDVKVATFEITDHDISMSMFSGGARGTKAGTHTKLLIRGALWMSDTQAEYRDHWEAIHKATGRVLLNGLGLGCVARAILAKPEVTHLDIVESHERLGDSMIEHAPWLQDKRVCVHVADAYEQAAAWPKGTRWDVAWHDIWLDLCTDNLAGMARLHRSYGKRVGWQGSWGKEILQREKRREPTYW